MYLITQNTKGLAVAYLATAEQIKHFHNEPEEFPRDIVAWTVDSENDLNLELSGPEMVGIYNSLAGESLVKFPSKSIGAERTMPLVEKHAIPFEKLMGKTTDAPKKRRRGRADRGIVDIEPKERAVPCRPGTKQQTLISALSKGATIKQLVAALSSQHSGKDWKESSVKSGFYHDVNTLKGYGVRTEVVKEGDPSTYIYHLVYPKGITNVLDPKKSKAQSSDA